MQSEFNLECNMCIYASYGQFEFDLLKKTVSMSFKENISFFLTCYIQTVHMVTTHIFII